MLSLWFGALLIVASTLGAALSTTVSPIHLLSTLGTIEILTRLQPLQLIMTLGVLYGLGGCCIFAPCVVILDGYFVERRTLANGILCVSPPAPKKQYET
jgi:hypothetical protein